MNIHTPFAVPIILFFILGYTLMSILIVDIYPCRQATATAANNLVICELGASSSAAINPIAIAMGKGWAYTMLALIFVRHGEPCVMGYYARWDEVEKGDQVKVGYGGGEEEGKER